MLISISGSQGSGKSSLLREIKNDSNAKYGIVDRKTARSVLDDWNISLDEINSNSDLKIAFQTELLKRKYTDELNISLLDNIYLTERTYADLFVYSLIAFGQYNKYDIWIDDYYNKCKEMCESYAHVFFLRPFNSKEIECDGVRSINQHYSRMVDSILHEITLQMIPIDKLTIISTPLMEERINIIQDKISELSYS